MASAFVGEIRMFGGNFPPFGFARCDGALLSIAQNSVLFNLIGTTYGGDGQVTFALPDMRGRIPIHQSNTNVIGSAGGAENVTLAATQIPPHTHDLRAAAGGSKTTSPADAWFASGGPQQYASNRVSPLTGTLQQGITSFVSPQPHDNMMPYATVTFIIALEGIFPSRN